MQRTAFFIVASLLLLSGCRATGEAVYDGVFDFLWDVGTDAVAGSDRLTEDDKYIARRKRLSHDAYRSLKSQEKQWREFRAE